MYEHGIERRDDQALGPVPLLVADGSLRARGAGV